MISFVKGGETPIQGREETRKGSGQQCSFQAARGIWQTEIWQTETSQSSLSDDTKPGKSTVFMEVK